MKRLLQTVFICLLAVNCFSQSFTNPSLEFWVSPTLCETNTPPDGWSNYSNVGLGPDEANFPLCQTTIPPNAANGNVYARCLSGNPTTGEGMFQHVSGFIIGTSYAIGYSYSGSNLFGGNGDCIWHLFIDDIDVNQSAVFSSLDTVWHINSYTFLATATMHKIGVRAYTPTFNGGGSAAIDLFTISNAEPTGIINNSISKEIYIGPNPFDNNLTIRNAAKNLSSNIILFDAVGQVVFNHEFSEMIVIDTEMLPRGIYFYQVISENSLLQKGKVVKE